MARGAQATQKVRKAEKRVAATSTGKSRATVSSTVPNNLAQAPITAQDVSALGTGLIHRAIVAQNSPILAMPQEVQQRIYRYAVTHEESICPVQYERYSNKFFWSKRQAQAHASGGPSILFPPLTAVALSQTCRQMYDSVANTHIFYEENHFDFTNHGNEEIITFLVALTDERRNHIRHVDLTVETRYYKQALLPEVFVLIAAAKGIKTLCFQLLLNQYSKATWKGLKGYKQIFHAVEGLKKLEVLIKTSDGLANAKEFARVLEAPLKAHMEANPRRGNKIKLGELERAKAYAILHVHGEGRLSDDKKPGMVSSRTRAAIRNLQNLDVNGVLPQREVPRYNLNGDLTWSVEEVKDSREVKSDDGSVLSVEFLVRIRPPFSTRDEEAWEDVSVLTLDHAPYYIALFYQSEDHQNAVGREVVLDIWKLRRDAHEASMRYRIQMLVAVGAKQAKIREQQEKHEQAEALKAQTLAAKAAAKKPPRTSTPGKSLRKAAGSGNSKAATSSATPAPAGLSKVSGKRAHKSVSKLIR